MVPHEHTVWFVCKFKQFAENTYMLPIQIKNIY